VSGPERDEYRSPLVTRYAGRRIRAIFSERHRIVTWRQLWVWLAEAERELGLDISAEQVAALQDAVEEIDFERAADYEARFRHDVMAHVHAFGDAVPGARGVIHLGATSCYVTDNADAILLREGLEHVALLIAEAVGALADLARRTAEVPCLAYTHFQPAQPTTMGKRACLWVQDLLQDLEDVERAAREVPFLGSKGTTGTQASFLALFDGDAEKVRRLDHRIAQRAGFAKPVAVSGQTYPRKADFRLLAALGGIAVSASKLAHDIRLLSALREVSEPFGAEQVGSSAMAYKQNPMRSERITSLARHLLSMVPEAGQMAATQWLERTLDDSAGRRLFLPEAFLAADAILRLVVDVARGLRVNEAVMRARLGQELPFMATEEILMQAAKAGGDRQALHERIRQHSVAAREALLAGATRNDLLDRIAGDEAFAAVRAALPGLTAPERFTGMAAEQARHYLDVDVQPALAPYRDRLGADPAIRV
jgi:adenylosuccinate lyase